MLSNLHTHSTFCDGKNTPEEIVRYAIDNRFDSIGFSGHGYTDFDLRYCMKNTDAYIETVRNLQKKYKDKIQIYLGVEEDAFCEVKRSDFDYIIGSSHYICIDGRYMPIDSNYDYFKKCLEAFDYDILKFSEIYYSNFCSYIKRRKPDIVGHFDLITKFDEIDTSLFLNNPDYLCIADKYMESIAECNVIFELNTGAISRNLRNSPYPHERLLYILKKYGAKLTLSSDSHNVETLSCYFDEAKMILKDIGFENVYALYDGKFKPVTV